ncbi:MAG: hypothetical protein FWF91_05875 [Coriobacteriia bacterium]|nr:hypothetical protein [Coriobacteriia bacterium]
MSAQEQLLIKDVCRFLGGESADIYTFYSDTLVDTACVCCKVEGTETSKKEQDDANQQANATLYWTDRPLARFV